MALNAQGSTIKVNEALDVLSEASLRDPSNPQVCVLPSLASFVS
jgi:hypothetical protein